MRRYLHPNTPFVGDPSICVDIASWIAHLVRDNRFAYFRIEHPMYGFIGHSAMNDISLEDMSFSRACVIGESSCWNKGIGGQVGEMLLDHAKMLGFKTVTASAHKDNIASVKNLRKQFDREEEKGMSCISS
ncbi:MAG: GNAT family N-acetyltransferase [Pseudomonadales bacterium]|nr:GNAT family N-acetyltransferase [Pseudomonadales bacterium]